MTKHKNTFRGYHVDDCSDPVASTPDSGVANDDLESLRSEFDAYRADQESMVLKLGSDISDLQSATAELKSAVAALKGSVAPKPNEAPASGQDNGSGTVTPIDPATGAPVDPNAPTEPAPVPSSEQPASVSDVTLQPGERLTVKAGPKL